MTSLCDMTAPRASGPTIGRHHRTSTSTLISTPTNVPRKYKRKCNGRKRGNGRPFRRKIRAVGETSQPGTPKKRVCVHSVPPRRSVKMASLSTRSTSAQTEDPAWSGISLWDWLRPTATKTAAIQTADPGVDKHSLHQWRSIQGKRRPRARSLLEQVKDRICSSSQDMHALNRSCCVELVRSSLTRAKEKAQSTTKEEAL